jgi:hypothetical protein
MNTFGKVEVQLNVFLASALDGGKWSTSLPGRFTTGEKDPRRLHRPKSRSGLDEEKNLLPPPGIEPQYNQYGLL